MRCANIVRGGMPLLIAAGAMVAGCGVSRTTADSVASTTSTVVPAVTTTLPGDPIADIRIRIGTRKDFCARARAANSRLSVVLSGKGEEVGNEAAWREVDAQLRRLLGEVPSVLVDEATAVAANFVAYLRVVQRHAWDVSRVSADAATMDEIIAIVDDADAAGASARLEWYMSKRCKIALDR